MTNSGNDYEADSAFRAWAADAVGPRALDVESASFAARRVHEYRFIPILAAAGVVVLVAILGICFVAFRSNDEPAGVASPPVSAQLTQSPPMSPAGTGAAGGVTARLILDATTVPADGQRILGRVEITNLTGRRIPIMNPCNGWVDVGLVNDTVSFEPAHTAKACATEYLPTGSSSTRVSLPTSYLTCQPGHGSLAPGVLRCTEGTNSGLPALAPGTYMTKIIFTDVGHGISAPPSTRVTLTRP